MLPVRSLTEVLEQAPSMFLRRYPVFLLGVFAAFALVLAAVGIFGVVSYGVVERTREFGVRMAVGAARRDIVRLVLRRNLPPVLAGAAAGVVGAVVLALVFRGLLLRSDRGRTRECSRWSSASWRRSRSPPPCSRRCAQPASNPASALRSS